MFFITFNIFWLQVVDEHIQEEGVVKDVLVVFHDLMVGEEECLTELAPVCLLTLVVCKRNQPDTEEQDEESEVLVQGSVEVDPALLCSP